MTTCPNCKKTVAELDGLYGECAACATNSSLGVFPNDAPAAPPLDPEVGKLVEELEKYAAFDSDSQLDRECTKCNAAYSVSFGDDDWTGLCHDCAHGLLARVFGSIHKLSAALRQAATVRDVPSWEGLYLGFVLNIAKELGHDEDYDDTNVLIHEVSDLKKRLGEAEERLRKRAREIYFDHVNTPSWSAAEVAGLLDGLADAMRADAKPAAKEAPSGETEADQLHPTGRCTCGGEGECAWCKARQCPSCYDGGACLPGGCGVPGCERCGKMCPTCNGSCEIANPLNPDAPLPAGREGK